LGILIVLGLRIAAEVEFLFDQSWLMNFSDPQTMVVYDEDPMRAQQLLKSPRIYESLGGLGAARMDPEQWESYPGGNKNVGGWKVFLHKRSLPAGGARLVVVALAPSSIGE